MINTNPLTLERLIDAPVQKVWQALTDKDQMKQWYFVLDDFKAEKGFKFSFAGKGSKGEEYIHLCKVIEAIPLKKLTYSWTYKDVPGYSEVTFELIEQGSKTLVKLSHTGLESFPQDKPDFGRNSFNGGWTELITKLLPAFVEKG
jgi:uncharacterized protein YndB with AHSA1/START domain